MVDQITEIFLPGRTVASPASDARGRATGVTLPSFVTGPENRLVATVVGWLIDDDSPLTRSDSPCGPTFLALYGPTGCGKTHLARGIVRYWQEHRGSDCAEYLTASDFRREFTAAVEADTVAEFRQRVRSRQLLAVDDLHQLPNDAYLLQELRNTLDEYEQNGGTVLVTSTQPTGTLPKLSPDLRSRLASGLVLQLASPGSAARRHFVRQVASALGQPIRDEAARRLADGIQGTANDLFGAVFELCANPSHNGNDLEQTSRLLAARAALRPTLRRIIAVVAKYYKQPQTVLKSASRRQSAVLPRAVIVYLARELADVSYDQIGRALGGRDHTTIMHNYRKIQSDRQHDLGLQEALDELRSSLLGG